MKARMIDFTVRDRLILRAEFSLDRAQADVFMKAVTSDLWDFVITPLNPVRKSWIRRMFRR